MNINRQITKVKHEVTKTLFIANHLLNMNGWKIAMIVLIGLIVLRKDISLQFNLKSPMQYEQVVPTATNTQGQAELMNQKLPMNDVEVPTKPTNSVKLPKGNPTKKNNAPSNAPSISGLGLILNPNYAKRNNIDPKIVKQKKMTVNEYVKRFAPVAVSEMNKYNIPASITLAQGLLESNVGQSRLATDNKNHFGIKCFSKNCKAGHCTNHTDDSHKDFFRKYNSVWESYRAHSLFLQRKRYRHLLKLPRTDYKSWAKGLSKAGYATDKRYPEKIIGIIENLELHRFDK